MIRPSTRDSYEFRSDPFSKISRRLEDFHIDLSSIFPEGGAAPEPAAPASILDFDFEDDFDEDDFDEEEPYDSAATSEME